jgi:hypothetical protein
MGGYTKSIALSFSQEGFLNLVIFLAIVLLSPNVFAHGEDKPGPHGGFIKMPGAFHTELVQLSPNQLRVYLLDIDFKNPVVENSNIKISTRNKKLINAKCKPEKDSFLCDFPKSISLTRRGSLRVAATRLGQAGVPIEYKIPFSLPDAESGSHHDHH